MIGRHVKCKRKYSYPTVLAFARKETTLTEPHEAGEIIRDYYLILNKDVDTGPFLYEPGDCVPVLDIRYFDIFETDKKYDDRDDLVLHFENYGVVNGRLVTTYAYGCLTDLD